MISQEDCLILNILIEFKEKFGVKYIQGINNPEEQWKMEWFVRNTIKVTNAAGAGSSSNKKLNRCKDKDKTKKEHEARMARLEEEHQARWRMNKEKFGKKIKQNYNEKIFLIFKENV